MEKAAKEDDAEGGANAGRKKHGIRLAALSCSNPSLTPPSNCAGSKADSDVDAQHHKRHHSHHSHHSSHRSQHVSSMHVGDATNDETASAESASSPTTAAAAKGDTSNKPGTMVIDETKNDDEDDEYEYDYETTSLEEIESADSESTTDKRRQPTTAIDK
jgi:hypothetical protein